MADWFASLVSLFGDNVHCGNTPRLRLTRARVVGLLMVLAVLLAVAGIAHTWVQARAEEAVRPDDALPPGSILRFGTFRFRFGIPVSMMAISNDGKMAVAVNGNHMEGTARVFDLLSGQVLYSMGSGDIEAAAISPDGQTIVTKQDFSLRIRDAATGNTLRTIGLQRANEYSRNEWLTFTPDGTAIAVTSQGKVIHLIDIESGTTIREFSHDNPESILSSSFATVLGIAFSPDGRLMAAGGFDNDQGTYFARLWDVESGKELRRFMHSKYSYGIPSLAFSPDAKMLATRSHDGRLRLFDVDTGKERKTFPEDGGGRKLGSAAFSPDGKTVVAAGRAAIRFYDTTTGAERLRIDRPASHLQFTDGGTTLTGAVMGAIYRWDAATGKPLTPEVGDSVVEQILVSPDGRRVITRGQRGDAHIWDGTSGQHLRGFQAAWQHSLAMSPDGRFLVWPVEDESIHFPDPLNAKVSYDGSRILVYEIAADKYVDRFPGFPGDAQDLAFTDDGKQLLTVDHRDGMVRCWDFETGKAEQSFQAVPDAEKNQSRQVTHAVLSPDGQTLAVAYHPVEPRGPNGETLLSSELDSRPRPIRFWDATTGKELRQLGEAYGAMAFSPDGRFFVSSSGIVWDTATGSRVTTLPETTWIAAVAFSRDGRFLATVVSRDVIRLWDVATWTKQKDFTGHRDRPTTLTFTPRGKLLSGSVDTTVLAWDLQ